MSYTPQDLQELIKYNQRTGELVWRPRTEEIYERYGNPSPRRACTWFNASCAGNPLGTTTNHGVASTRISLGSGTPTLRRAMTWVAWVVATGTVPDGQLRVGDGDQNNLRPANVVLCSAHVARIMTSPSTGIFSYELADGGGLRWGYNISQDQGAVQREVRGFMTLTSAREARDKHLKDMGLWFVQTLAQRLRELRHA